MTTKLTPALFETVPCRTCRQDAGSPCIVKRGPRGRTHHIARQVSAIAKQEPATTARSHQANGDLTTSGCTHCSAVVIAWGLPNTTEHHPECQSQYKPRTRPHRLPMMDAAGNPSQPLTSTTAEQE